MNGIDFQFPVFDFFKVSTASLLITFLFCSLLLLVFWKKIAYKIDATSVVINTIITALLEPLGSSLYQDQPPIIILLRFASLKLLSPQTNPYTTVRREQQNIY